MIHSVSFSFLEHLSWMAEAEADENQLPRQVFPKALAALPFDSIAFPAKAITERGMFDVGIVREEVEAKNGKREGGSVQLKEKRHASRRIERE